MKQEAAHPAMHAHPGAISINIQLIINILRPLKPDLLSMDGMGGQEMSRYFTKITHNLYFSI